jgi:hypothetical protein
MDSVPPEVKTISWVERQLIHRLPGLFQGLGGLIPGLMGAGGIAVIGADGGDHGLLDLG